jgi:hypothetical protein
MYGSYAFYAFYAGKLLSVLWTTFEIPGQSSALSQEKSSGELRVKVCPSLAMGPLPLWWL